MEWDPTITEKWNDTITEKYSGFPHDLLCKLRILELNGAPFEEICPDQHAGTFEDLTQLKLSKMPWLKHLWKENSEIRDFKLQKLEVSECDGLETFVLSSISFQNLKKLKVSKCHGLSSLVTSSAAKSLLHLTKMVIFECNIMTEIVASEGREAVDEIACEGVEAVDEIASEECEAVDEITSEKREAVGEITFRQLKSLTLRSLGRLTSFYSGNCTIIFPSLEELTVIKCPQLKIFSNGDVSAPKLKGVKLAK